MSPVSNKIKILFAIGRLTVGGGEKLLVYQLKEIDRNRFEPYLITLFPEKEESFGPFLRSNLSEEVRPLEYWWKRMNFRSLFDLVSWFRLISFLKKEKFDVVVTSLFSANLIVRLALFFAGRPKVLISYEHNIYPNKRKWQIFMDRFLARRTDKIIVDAESVKKFTASQEKIPEEKFLVMHIPPLADVKAGPFTKGPALNLAGGSILNDLRREFGIGLSDKIILTVSRLVEEKGHKYLIRAAKGVCEKFPAVKFLIVGWGPLKEELEKEIRLLSLAGDVKVEPPAGGSTLNVSAKVILAGQRDIADVLPLADIYIEPALTVDIGIASMEAMAVGLPIISTNVGEMSVFVKDGENGFLVPPANEKALAEKILFLLKNDDLRKKMGEKSKEQVKDFSIDKYMVKFEELIFSLCYPDL